MCMKIINRRVRHDYSILDSFEAGIVLTGAEVKSIKQGRGNLSGSFVRVRDGEAWLMGADIPRYGPAGNADYDPTRPRKLLLHKKEIISLSTKVRQQQLTLVPLSLYTKGRLVKAQIALAKGKKKYEKREAKKRKDIEREVNVTLKRVQRELKRR